MREAVLGILSRYLNIYFSGKRSLHVAIIYTGRLIFPMWVCLHVQDDKWYEPYNKVCSMCVLSFRVDRQLRPQNWRRKKTDIPHVRHLNTNLMHFRTPQPQYKKINETTFFSIPILSTFHQTIEYMNKLRNPNSFSHRFLFTNKHGK